tara:strand:+ start:930 stop:1676 length:747 start_codon:yes stop_codon:yes gene_type:complete
MNLFKLIILLLNFYPTVSYKAINIGRRSLLSAPFLFAPKSKYGYMSKLIIKEPPITFKKTPFSSPPAFPLSFNLTALNNERKRRRKEEQIDWYAQWTFFNIAPPPIEKVLTYEQLIQEIKNNNIVSVEIAVQHDCVVATTNIGHRWSCLIRDKDFPKLLEDSKDDDGNLPFIVLPIDMNKAFLRTTAQIFLACNIALYVAADLDLIDYDTTSYGNWEERQKAYKSGKKPKKYLKSIIDYLFKKNTTDI